VEYWLAVAVAAALGAVGCVAARRVPGRAATGVGRLVSVMLLADAITYVIDHGMHIGWTASGSLPLNLCDVALIIAAVTCWYPDWALGVELTYFWGLTGTLQAVLTPDLSARFPQLEFFEFVVGHAGIVVAALYLVLGLRREPRPGAVSRVFAITVVYTAVVGVVDLATGGNYMYLARLPRHSSLLSALGPWPWYIASAAAVCVGLFVLLDAPFRRRPTPPGSSISPPGSGGPTARGTTRRLRA
jgi:hypothetical integral membrane protein (TIGR02206 family)